MAKKRAPNGSAAPVNGDGTGDPALDFRHHHAKRPNNPTAGNSGEGKVEPTPRIRYHHDPHRPPTLRFDPTGKADALTEPLATLMAEARKRPLTAEEVATLTEALHANPWLEWSGKREQPSFVVDTPAIHLHERVSSRALMRVAARKDVQRSLFGGTDLSYSQSVQFYHHSVNWANRLILGDNRAVMASLAHREKLAGKVQMIYIDPPYGIKFASNFQPEIGKRDVSDKDVDFTREMEMVQAYRDTWHLGIHSYMSYLREILSLSSRLLSDSGSVFVQIGDENEHLVHSILAEVFGSTNFVAKVVVQKTGGLGTTGLKSVADYLLWACKDKSKNKYNQLYQRKTLGVGHGSGARYDQIETGNGCRGSISATLLDDSNTLSRDARVYQLTSLMSGAFRPNTSVSFSFQGETYHPGSNACWKTTLDGLSRLVGANRIQKAGRTPRFVRYLKDFEAYEITNVWNDVAGSSEKVYVVQTSTSVIERCMLMASDPGDLVLDPTCGSGTTAVVAEQWGRRWITIDTSRVALAIARQRIMTAKFDYYRLRDEVNGPTGGFYYKTVAHVTLKSIAQNAGLDPIFAKHEPILVQRLDALNAALKTVTAEVRSRMQSKLAAKRKAKDRDDPVTDADERRWNLPAERWEEWQVPFDADPDWPAPLRDALVAYRKAWRAKRDEVDGAIAANAEQEPLVDQPDVVKGIVRVSGPFTVEALQPAEESLDGSSPVDDLDGDLETFAPGATSNAEAYLDKMLRLLRADGVRFPNNVEVRFDRLEPLSGGLLNAAGEWRTGGEDGDARSVAVVFGPQYGPITGNQVESALRAAHRARVYDDLVFAGFSFDSAAQAIIQDDPNPVVRCHLAHIRPDVNLDGLLKETPKSQLFTVFGLPRARLEDAGDEQVRVVMEGVDIYNPVKNEIVATGADKVAAWFLDSDYDGKTFCICQAFFPNRSAWDKLGKALKGLMDEDALASFSGTESLPFDPPSGPEPRVAVKVIDPRGNEVLRVLRVPAGA